VGSNWAPPDSAVIRGQGRRTRLAGDVESSEAGERKGIAMMWFDDGTGSWGYATMTIGMVVCWGLIIAATVVLVRQLTRAGRPAATPQVDRPSSPEQVLAERFARGEIDEEDYRRRVDTLRAVRNPAARS
jgi:putative membrane protein